MENLFTQEIQDMLQGPTLLEVLSDPVGLRSTIVALESAIELLRDNEQRLYPEQAPKAGRSKRNEGISDTSDPAWQRDKILRVFQKTHQTFTPTQLHGQYIKSVDAALLEARCDELVGLGDLVALKSRRSNAGKYCLPSDVPSDPELPKSGPDLPLLRIGDKVIPVEVLGDQDKDKNGHYHYVLNHDKNLRYRVDSPEGEIIAKWRNKGDHYLYISDTVEPPFEDEEP
jgi:hypothetical protein